jgi:rod shape determining protein RodA
MNYPIYNNQKTKPDWLTIVLYLVLATFGILNVFSASTTPDDAYIFDFTKNHGKQLIYMMLSLVLGFFIMLTDAGFFRMSAYVIYGLVISALIAVLVMGTTVAASKSWIEIGSFRLQPAEFAKYGAILALAKFFSGFDVKLKGFKNTFIPLVLIGIPMLLTLAQNDTGSALVFLSFALVLFREGMPGFWLALGVYLVLLFVLSIVFENSYIYLILSVIAGMIIYVGRKNKKLIFLVVILLVGSIGTLAGVDYFFYNVLKQYQQDRILVILNLKEDNQGIGYNLNQSKIAIGAGQLSGRGFMNGTQNRMGFVPEQSTDFIFCTIGEEWGVGMILLYLIFLGRLVWLAERQRTKFSRIVGVGAFSVLLFHFIINIGMTIGLVPVIGIPLPYFSYGGSSFLSFSILLFTFLSLDSRRVFEISRIN